MPVFYTATDKQPQKINMRLLLVAYLFSERQQHQIQTTCVKPGLELMAVDQFTENPDLVLKKSHGFILPRYNSVHTQYICSHSKKEDQEV